MQRLGAVVVALGLACGIAAADAPRTQKQQEADKLFAEGRDLLVNKHDPKAACEKFELAATADPTAAGTMLNLGLCYEELGKPHTAIKWFRAAKNRASETHLPDHEEAATKHSQELAKIVPVISIVFTGAQPLNPRVRIDDEEIAAAALASVEVDPGDHVIEVRAPHRKLSRGHITVAPRDPKVAEAIEVRIALEEGEPTIVLDKGRNRRLAALGLGIVALGAWTFDFAYGIHESRLYHCAVDHKGCSETVDSSGKQLVGQALTDYANARVNALKYTGTTVFVLGAAALATGAYLFFTAPGKVTVEQVGGDRVTIAPVLAPSQVGFAITGGF